MISTMHEEKKKYICRVCLVAVKKKSLSIFEEFRDCLIFEHINTISNVNISKGDSLPDRICPDCLLELETAVNFKQKCESSNVVLRTSLVLPTLVERSFKDVTMKEEDQNTEYLEDNFVDADYNEDFDTKPIGELLETSLGDDTDAGNKSKAINLKLQCDDCGDIFRTKCKLRVHWKRVHLPQALICHTCKRTFKSVKSFQRHEKVKSLSCTNASNFRIEGLGKNRRFFCKECAYSSHRMKDMISHWVTHTGDRPYACDICGKTCTQQSSLQAHKESAHKQYHEITCHHCGKLIKGKNKFYRHLKTHNERNLACQYCNKLFKTKNSLAVHKQRHTGIKPYTCEKCARTFYSLAELCNHKRTIHNKTKQVFNCDLCEYKAFRKEMITRHRAKHVGTDIPCTTCGRFYESAQKLLLHQRRHFEEKKYQCPQCDARFFRRDSVNKHVRTKHGFRAVPTEKRVGLSVKMEGPQNAISIVAPDQLNVKQEAPQNYDSVAIDVSPNDE